MLLSVALSLMLVVLATSSHLAVLSGLRTAASGLQTIDSKPALQRVLARMTRPALILASVCSHLWTAALFAFGFWLGHTMDLGGFDPAETMGAMDLYNYSVINMTTLGLGDVRPTGHLRFMAGIESLTGFILIGCTAQFVFEVLHARDADSE